MFFFFKTVKSLQYEIFNSLLASKKLRESLRIFFFTKTFQNQQYDPRPTFSAISGPNCRKNTKETKSIKENIQITKDK